MGQAQTASLSEYEITEEDAAKLNNTVSVGDKYPFLAVSEDDDGNTVGHLFLPHVVTSHRFVNAAKAEAKAKAEEDAKAKAEAKAKAKADRKTAKAAAKEDKEEAQEEGASS